MARDKDPPDAERALVPAGRLQIPETQLAESLETAGPKSLVYVDATGRVRSPAHYRLVSAVAWVVPAALIACTGIFYGVFFGPLAGALAGGAVLALTAWRVRPFRILRQATRLMVHDRLDEAEALLDRLVGRRLPAATRAEALYRLAVIALRRGDQAAALERVREVLAVQVNAGRANRLSRRYLYAEINCLINLDRVAEARQRFARLQGPAPEGDYLRLAHWTAELHLAFAEGKHTLSADELHERARVALRITMAGALLGLLSWAHVEIGDRDQAWHLLREAYDRMDDVHLDKTMPRLYAWLESHKKYL